MNKKKSSDKNLKLLEDAVQIDRYLNDTHYSVRSAYQVDSLKPMVNAYWISKKETDDALIKYEKVKLEMLKIKSQITIAHLNVEVSTQEVAFAQANLDETISHLNAIKERVYC